MKKITIEEFQNRFEELLNRVENGESFILTGERVSAVMIPYNEMVEVIEDDDLVRIHTNHEEGS
jgi:prevent-host-death family protein